MNKPIKLIAFLIFGIVGLAQCAFAHEVSGAIGRKNSKAGGTDEYNVSCYDDGNGEPDHLFVQVTDTPRPRNPSRISIAVFPNPPTGVFSGVTLAPNDSSVPSSPIEMKGGNGSYIVDISKIPPFRKKGAEVYYVTFHCETAGGAHTGTNEPELTQNQ